MVVGETTPEGTSRGHTPTVFTVWGFQLPTEKKCLGFRSGRVFFPFPLLCEKNTFKETLSIQMMSHLVCFFEILAQKRREAITKAYTYTGVVSHLKKQLDFNNLNSLSADQYYSTWVLFVLAQNSLNIWSNLRKIRKKTSHLTKNPRNCQPRS